MEKPRRSDVYEATELTLTRKESQATAADVAEPITEHIDETQADNSSSESEITITETATATVTQKPDNSAVTVDDKTEPKDSIQQSVKEAKETPNQPEQTGQPERPEAPPKLQPQPNAPPPAQTQSAPVFVGNGNEPNKETKEELYHTRKVSHGLKNSLNET